MEKINYELPKKALSILNDLAEAELYQVSFYMYLSFCCSNEGYPNASEHFYRESSSERSHYKRIADYIQSRGIEPEVPKVDKPDIAFTDLRSGIKAAYELEIVNTRKYDEAIRMMCEIDTMSYGWLLQHMETQRYSLESLNKLWATFVDLKAEDQKEQDQLYWLPKPESPALG